MNLLEARNKLNMTQAQAAEMSGMKPKQISLMEQGKAPIDAQYARWLGQQLVSRYRKIADMPSQMLRQLIRNREEL